MGQFVLSGPVNETLRLCMRCDSRLKLFKFVQFRVLLRWLFVLYLPLKRLGIYMPTASHRMAYMCVMRRRICCDVKVVW